MLPTTHICTHQLMHLLNPGNSRSQSSLSGRDSDSMDNEVTLSKMDVVLSFALEVRLHPPLFTLVAGGGARMLSHEHDLPILLLLLP